MREQGHEIRPIGEGETRATRINEIRVRIESDSFTLKSLERSVHGSNNNSEAQQKITELKDGLDKLKKELSELEPK